MSMCISDSCLKSAPGSPRVHNVHYIVYNARRLTKVLSDVLNDVTESRFQKHVTFVVSGSLKSSNKCCIKYISMG